MAKGISRRPVRISPTCTTAPWSQPHEWQRAAGTACRDGSSRCDRQAGARPSAVGLGRGIAAFAAGDHDDAVRILAPLMPELVRIGGSHAQRELWEDTFIVACLRAGPRPASNRADRGALASPPLPGATSPGRGGRAAIARFSQPQP